MQRNLRLTPLMLRVFPPTGFNACRRSRATGFAGRAARSAAQRQDRGAGESRRNGRLFNPRRIFRLFSPAPLPCLCSARELAWRHQPNWRRLFVLRPEAGSPDWVSRGASSARKTCPWAGNPGLRPAQANSEKRAGRPRIQAGPLAKSSRARSSRTFPLQLLVSHSYHDS